MKLAVAAWYPYQHQAAAFQQLLGTPALEQVPLEQISNSLQNVVVGPFISLMLEDDDLPLLGLPSIAEYFHRRHPEKHLFPDDIVLRGHVRAFATMIEERFSRFCISDITSYAGYNRPVWNSASKAPEMIPTTPPDLSGLVKISERFDLPFLASERPGLADALLAAMWWTLEDQGKTEELSVFPWLAQWYARNCNGQTFQRDPSIRR